MTVEMSPIPIELINAWVNSEVAKMPPSFSTATFLGQKVASVRVDASLNDRETIQSTGMSASRMATVFAVPHVAFCLPVVAIVASTFRARRRRAEALDEQERDDRDAEEDQDRNRGPDAEVQRGEQVVVTEDRHRAGVVAARGQDEDVVEYPKRVERPEKQRDEYRRLHQGQRDPDDPLPRRRAVHHRRLGRILRNERQPRHEEQSHERRGL